MTEREMEYHCEADQFADSHIPKNVVSNCLRYAEAGWKYAFPGKNSRR